MNDMKNITNLLAIFVFLLVVAVSCAVNPVTGKKELSFMSEGQELSIGKESDPAVIAQFGLYDNDTLQKFIQREGEAMVKVSHKPDMQFKFRLLDSDVINAFAVPGGYVYFTRGIMAYMNNEAQFAGVLGHEIGHITARHAAQQYTKQMITQVALVGGMIFSEKLRNMGEQAMQGMQLLFLKFSRDDEMQSDKLGVQYSSLVGYDATEMAKFFTTLGRVSGNEGQRLPEFMSTHPDPGNRFVDVTNYAKQWQAEHKATNLKVNRNQYLEMIDGIVYGEDPRQGYLDKATSTFYHPEMKFQFPIPNAWQYQNSPTQVQVASADGKAAIIMTLSSKKTLKEATDEVITAYGLKLLAQPNNKTINGLNAVQFVGQYAENQEQQQQQQSQVLTILTTLIEYNGNIYIFLGMSDAADYNTYKHHFTATANGFKPLTDISRINVKPERIKVVKVEKTATLSNVLAQHKIPQTRYEELAIVNGMETKTEIPAGTLIKIVQKN